MATPGTESKQRKGRYTADRGIPGSFDGETVTRRRVFEGGAQAVGGVAAAAFGLPVLGFALGPLFRDSQPQRYQDVGPETDFNTTTYVPKVISLVPGVGEAGKTTVYVRKFNPGLDRQGPPDRAEVSPYIVLTTRCSHLGCPVRYVQASSRFICPCHGGIYDFDGSVAGGPPVRPLDRFYTRVVSGRVLVGDRYSLNSELDRHAPRDPSNHLDGLWQYLYPPRPTT